ncbi:hypothetical protein DFH09DRAFT_1299632 [Mycena vulgaris]|nr:hypothetical protein DFH09DRAFT_1299632 [Mycena vulgaris]
MALSTSPLPQELVDIVIDDIQDDPASLKTCSYVSASFRRSSQRHIFSHITLLPPWNATSSTLCQNFYEVLVSAPHLASYVHCLDIIEGCDPDGGRIARDLPWVTSEKTLELVLPLLRLRHLSLHCTWPASFLVSSLRGTLKARLHDVIHSPALKSLSLGRMTFTPSAFHFFLGDCMALKELILTSVSVYSALEVENTKTFESDARPTQLESLDLVESDGEVMELLLSPQSPVDLRCLRTLSIYIYGYVGTPLHVTNLIQRPRVPLRHLNVRGLPVMGLTDFDFITAQHVRSLCIAPEGLPSWRDLFQNCSPHLENLTLELSLPYFLHCSELEWEDLVAVLTRPKMTQLREVSLKVYTDPVNWTQELKTTFAHNATRVKGFLSALSARGVLEVESIAEKAKPIVWVMTRQEEDVGSQAEDECDDDDQGWCIDGNAEGYEDGYGVEHEKEAE